MTLIVPYIDEAKASLGNPTIRALSLIFAKSSGLPPATSMARFRADNPELMNELDILGWKGFYLKRNDTQKTYRISGYALPLLDSPHSAQLIECMNVAYEYMRTYYREHLDKQLLTKNLIEFMGIDKELALETLCYMSDINGWHVGLGNDFPIGEDSAFTVDERVLVKPSVVALFASVYEAEYVNSQTKPTIQSNWLTFGELGGSSGFFNGKNEIVYPEWYEELDNEKKALINEIDISMRNSLLALPIIGLRALLESVMIEHVGDSGSFTSNVSKFEKEGFVTSQQTDILRKILDAGSASMHRGYIPNVEDISTCVNAVKHLLQGVYVLHPKVKGMAKNIPPRLKPK